MSNVLIYRMNGSEPMQLERLISWAEDVPNGPMAGVGLGDNKAYCMGQKGIQTWEGHGYLIVDGVIYRRTRELTDNEVGIIESARNARKPLPPSSSIGFPWELGTETDGKQEILVMFKKYARKSEFTRDITMDPSHPFRQLLDKKYAVEKPLSPLDASVTRPYRIGNVDFKGGRPGTLNEIDEMKKAVKTGDDRLLVNRASGGEHDKLYLDYGFPKPIIALRKSPATKLDMVDN